MLVGTQFKALLRLYEGSNKALDDGAASVLAGTEVTCFTSSKVQILTQKLRQRFYNAHLDSQWTTLLSLLALLGQKYKY